MTVATDDEVQAAIAELAGWRRQDDELVCEVQFRDFEEAMRFAERVAACAVDYCRRPEMCISELNRVRLVVANPHHAGFTQAELRLVARVNAIVVAQG